MPTHLLKENVLATFYKFLIYNITATQVFGRELYFEVAYRNLPFALCMTS